MELEFYGGMGEVLNMFFVVCGWEGYVNIYRDVGYL